MSANGRPAAQLKETERVQAGPGPGRGPFGGGMVGQKSLQFGPSAKRLVARMRPDRGKALVVVLLGVASVTLMSIGPRILGHATDIVFNGFIGKQIPPGTPESEWPEAVQGQDVVPGEGVDFAAVAHVLMIVLAIYVGASLLAWLQGFVLNT
ncbi:MAG: ABC transporter ATP-binding protein, partial [Ornithinibacter sp.]